MIKNSSIQLHDGCIEQCRGCSHRNFSVDESATQKQIWLTRQLPGWSNVIMPVVKVDEENRYGYRNKVSLSALYTSMGWNFGMWNRNEFIPIPRCPIHSLSVNSIIDVLRQDLPSFENFPLHYLIIAEKQVTLVLKTVDKPTLAWFSSNVKNQFSATGAEALWIHLNPSAGHRMFEKTPWILVWGKEHSFDYKGFQYGPTSFHQLIPGLYQQSLSEAHTYLNPDKNSFVADLYCGIGHSLNWWAGSGAHVLGIESSAEAVCCAAKNVPEAMVFRGQCHTRVNQITQIMETNNLSDKTRLLYVNPPRTGLGEKVLNWVLTVFLPKRIAYLSCSAGTLSRDLKILTDSNYSVKKIIPYDFFPGTHHVETLVLIEKEDESSF